MPTPILTEDRIVNMSEGTFRRYRKAAIIQYQAALDRVYPTCGCEPPCYRERETEASPLSKQMLETWDGVRRVLNRELKRREREGQLIRGSRRWRTKKKEK